MKQFIFIFLGSFFIILTFFSVSNYVEAQKPKEEETYNRFSVLNDAIIGDGIHRRESRDPNFLFIFRIEDPEQLKLANQLLINIVGALSFSILLSWLINTITLKKAKDECLQSEGDSKWDNL